MSSPQVINKEINLSNTIPSFPGTYGAIVLPAAQGKGPINSPQLVTSETQFLNMFTPNQTVSVGMDLAYYSALAYLQKSNKLWVSRAGHSDILSGGMLISHLNGAITLATGLTSPRDYIFGSQVDVPATAQVLTLTAVADVASSLNNTYFLLSSSTVNYYVWYNVGGAGVDPALVGKTGIQVAIAINATAIAVSIATAAAINALVGIFTCPVPATATFVVTNTVSGAPFAVPTAGTSGFTLVITNAGNNNITYTDDVLLLYASSPGTWANQVWVTITNYATSPTSVKVPGAFIIKVYTGINNLNLTLQETWTCSMTIGAKDGYGNNIYIEDVLNSSNFIGALVNNAVTLQNPADILTATALTKGSDGSAIVDADMITAANEFSNPDKLLITVIMDGGWATTAYADAIDAICQSRKDCVAVLSVPYSAEASATYLADIIAYRQTTLNLNSSYSALYTPHVLIYDKFNDRNLYVSPDGYAAAAISFSASNFEIWYPPAGFTRGLINVVDLRRRFTLGERDALYDVGINPIRFAPGRGIAIWGQKTLSSPPSALDRLNVRLLLITIEPAISAALDGFLFEFNDAPTRLQVTALINGYLANIQARRGLNDYQVICDTTNNTAAVIDANEMYVDVYIKPNKSAEFIIYRTIITSQTLSFTQAQSLV